MAESSGQDANDANTANWSDTSDMDEYRLPREFAYGFLEFSFAVEPAVGQIISSSHSGWGMSLTFWAKASRAKASATLVNIHEYRLPDELPEFENQIRLFGAQRMKRARLAEGVDFEPGMLAPEGVPAGWDHDGWGPKSVGRDACVSNG